VRSGTGNGRENNKSPNNARVGSRKEESKEQVQLINCFSCKRNIAVDQIGKHVRPF
jgi:hypothetical protein